VPEKPAISIDLVDPRLPAVTELVRELDRYMTGLYPAESNHLVDIETLAQPSVRFFAAAVDGEYCGCGAIMLRGRDYAEVKRVYVRPAKRGLGLAKTILATLEAAAHNEGVRRLRLETGTLQPGALRLFEDAGFVRCGPFGDYPADDPLSVFMEKAL
jgi:putative acetyltransferase